MTTPPTVDDELRDAVRAWCQISVTSLDDDALDQVIVSELVIQSLYVVQPSATSDTSALTQALYRRVARQCAARGVPLGLAGLENEYGGMRLPSFDPEIERLEAPYRVIAIA